MGEVYLAEDAKLGRRVAIKVLPERIAKRQNSLERFSREASAVGALNHPNIVTIHGLEEADGLRLIVMELVEGETLAGILPEEGLPADRFLAIALPLAEAVAAAHARGVIHRDIKPANIMVNAEGRVKVVDFGLAKLRPGLAESEAQATLTREGHLVGTVTYMSPEQLRGEPADARSDVFSLGTVLYELATGHHPFDGDTQPIIISSILCQDPQEITSVREAFPARLGAIVGRCLLKEPNERFADAGALHDALMALKERLDEERILHQARGRGRGPRRRAIGAAIGVALAIAVGVGAWRTLTPRTDPARPLSLGVRPLEAPTLAVEALPTVAVLHFRNLRDDPELEWLRTGLTEMVTTDLAQSHAFRVLSSEETDEVLKGIERDGGSRDNNDNAGGTAADLIRAVTDHAEVAAVVSGSFFRGGDAMRITYKLHDTATETVVLSEQLTVDNESRLFATIDELSRAVRAHLERSSTTIAGDRDLDTVTTASVEAYRYYVEGRNLRMQSKLQEAVPLLEKAVELDPRFAMAWARLAVVQRALGKQAEAQRCLEHAVAHLDRLPERERHYVEGQYYSDQRDTYSDAIAALQRAIDLDPSHQSARYTLASLYTFLDRLPEAQGHLELLHQQRSSIASTGVFLAYVHAAQDAEAPALAVLRDATERDPNSWWNHTILGWYQALFLRFEDAEDSLRRAEVLRPGASHLTKARWDAAILKRDWVEAERQARAGIAAADSFGRTNGQFEMAWLHLFRGRTEDAIEALLTDPNPGVDDPRAAALRASRTADVLLLLDRPNEADELARAATRDAPHDWPGRLGLFHAARANERLGRPREADRLVAQFAAIVEPELSQVEVRYARHLDGQLAHHRGDLAGAQVALAEADRHLLARGIDWRILPDHVAVWWSLGHNALSMGDDNRAIFWFRRIADSTTEHLRDPIRYVRSHFQLGRLYTRRGDHALARSAFEQFLAFWGDGTIDRVAVDEARAAVR